MNAPKSLSAPRVRPDLVVAETKTAVVPFCVLLGARVIFRGNSEWLKITVTDPKVLLYRVMIFSNTLSYPVYYGRSMQEYTHVFLVNFLLSSKHIEVPRENSQLRSSYCQERIPEIFEYCIHFKKISPFERVSSNFTS